MKSSKDKIKEYVPDKKSKLVILGTMASTAAREVGKRKSHSDSFYYHHKTNHFWRILQLVFEPSKQPKKFNNSDEKKLFLDKYKVAMGNIISEIKVDKNSEEDPSDTVIFRAMHKGHVKFKKLKPDFKKALLRGPIFFTCSANPKIKDLIQAYFDFNKLDLNVDKSVTFLMTLTRCNILERSLGWKIRMAEAGLKTKTVKIPT